MTSLMNKKLENLTVSEFIQILNEHSLTIPSQRTKGGKVKKVKDPNAPKKEVSAGVAAWNAVVAEVLEDMKASGWTHPETGKPVTRKDAMAEASKRKAADDPEYAAKAEARKQKRDSRKNSDASEHKEAAEEASKEAAKPKKVLSPEHLANMKAGREAKKAAAEPALVPVPVVPAPSPKKAKVVPKAEHAPAPADEKEEWIRKTISGKKYLWNPSNNHCYRLEADGSQGDWAGLYDPKKSKIDDSVEEPIDFEE
jgi:hypothetical protein